MPWDPRQYLDFERERLRPAIDLMARVPLARPGTILDLGCGAGNVTRMLADRWPEAAVTGVDSSAEMLARARSAMPAAAWVEADLRSWKPPASADLVFSNAALHWLEDHASLFPRIAGWVKPGGCLAVQMPASFDHPSHQAVQEIRRSDPWRDRFQGLRVAAGVHSLAEYHGWLAPLAKDVDLWETTYLHLLEGEDPVLEWFKGSLLVPYLDALPGEHHGALLEAYRQRVSAAYPKDSRGRTPMPFRRLFLVATF